MKESKFLIFISAIILGWCLIFLAGYLLKVGNLNIFICGLSYVTAIVIGVKLEDRMDNKLEAKILLEQKKKLQQKIDRCNCRTSREYFKDQMKEIDQRLKPFLKNRV